MHSELKRSSSFTEKIIQDFCPDNFVEEWKIEPKVQKKVPLLEIIKNGNLLEDTTVQVQNAEFRCHLLVLQNYSNFFRNSSKSDEKVILNSDKISKRSFQLIIEWILSNERKIERKHFLELIVAAEYLQIKKLLEQCWRLMENCRQFQEDEAFLLYIEAKKFQHSMIQKLMLTRICRFFLTAVSTRDFLEFNIEECKSFFESNNIGVNSEVDVFYSAVRWLLHNWEERQIHLKDLMSCVRFGLIVPWQIVEFRLNKKSESLQEILKNADLQEMLDSGLSYSTYRCSVDCDESSEHFNDFLVRFEFKRQYSRQLIDDAFWKEKFAHKFYRYEDFENYLACIGKNPQEYWKKIQIP